jgi:hypothetical protein
MLQTPPIPFRASLAATATVLTLSAGTALAGNESRFEAFPLEDGLFEVVARFSENAIYWCGAAVYATRDLRKPSNQRIYVWQGPTPSASDPGAISVRFGFTPPPEGPAANSFSNDVDIIGNSNSVVQARQGCTERSASG